MQGRRGRDTLMRAVQVTRFGGPDVLRLADVEKPSPISTEVLVRVIAAGINPVDAKTRRGEGVSRWVGRTLTRVNEGAFKTGSLASKLSVNNKASRADR